MAVDINTLDPNNLKLVPQTDLSAGIISSGSSTIDSLFTADTTAGKPSVSPIPNIGDILRSNNAKPATPTSAPVSIKQPKIEVVTVSANKTEPVKLQGQPEAIKPIITADQITSPKNIDVTNPEDKAAATKQAGVTQESKPGESNSSGRPEGHKPQEQGFLGGLASLATLAGLGWAVSRLFAGGGQRNDRTDFNGRCFADHRGYNSGYEHHREAAGLERMQAYFARNRRRMSRQECQEYEYKIFVAQERLYNSNMREFA